MEFGSAIVILWEREKSQPQFDARKIRTALDSYSVPTIIIFYNLKKRTQGPYPLPPAYGLYARENNENDGRPLSISPDTHWKGN
jgi:hypothetical protein